MNDAVGDGQKALCGETADLFGGTFRIGSDEGGDIFHRVRSRFSDRADDRASYLAVRTLER